MSGLLDHLSQICCCIEIDTGGYIIGVSRLILHLTRVIIAIILLTGGITKGIATTPPEVGSNETTGSSEEMKVDVSASRRFLDTPILQEIEPMKLEDQEMNPSNADEIKQEDEKITLDEVNSELEDENEKDTDLEPSDGIRRRREEGQGETPTDPKPPHDGEGQNPPSNSPSKGSNNAGKVYPFDKSSLTTEDMEIMEPKLTRLAWYWLAYYLPFFVISFIFVVGLKISNSWIMMPMVFMTAVDVFLAAYVPSPGILYAYMMSEVYEHPAIGLAIFWESAIGAFGIYIFAVVLGCVLAVREGDF